MKTNVIKAFLPFSGGLAVQAEIRMECSRFAVVMALIALWLFANAVSPALARENVKPCQCDQSAITNNDCAIETFTLSQNDNDRNRHSIKTGTQAKKEPCDLFRKAQVQLQQALEAQSEHMTLEAIALLEKSASRGVAAAKEFIVSEVVVSDLPLSYPQRVDLLERYAPHGSAEMQWDAAWFYMSGIHGPKNPRSARRWFRQAALQGKFEAQRVLGHIYASKDPDIRDLGQSYYWLYLAKITRDGLPDSHSGQFCSTDYMHKPTDNRELDTDLCRTQLLLSSQEISELESKAKAEYFRFDQ